MINHLGPKLSLFNWNAIVHDTNTITEIADPIDDLFTHFVTSALISSGVGSPFPLPTHEMIIKRKTIRNETKNNSSSQIITTTYKRLNLSTQVSHQMDRQHNTVINQYDTSTYLNIMALNSRHDESLNGIIYN